MKKSILLEGITVFGLVVLGGCFTTAPDEAVAPPEQFDDAMLSSFRDINGSTEPPVPDEAPPLESTAEQAFLNERLKTDTSQTEIDLSLVLDGGPGKNGIPAIGNPQFVSIEQADFVADDEYGIFLELNGEQYFYPYPILYWHEIVNQTIGETPVAVTFCPLCGSAIVYDRRIGERTLFFGVSGKLYESNLLMFDTFSESLWSQILGRAVVGEYTGTELKVIESDIITFGQVKENFVNAQVLSRNTGFTRDYDRSPYGNYEENDRLMFPVQNSDARFFAKDLFYIVNIGETSVGFQRKAMLSQESATVEVDGVTYTAELAPTGLIRVTNETGETVPGYTAMWFSWITHQEKPKVVWPESD
jgi:hypothetical protein